MENTKRVIEINGVKLEVDLRDAKIIDNYKVGDTVKILKEKYTDDFKSYLGVIVGFDDFEKHPTIIVCYLDVDYSGADIKFAHINSKSKDVEICQINEWDVSFTKQDVLDRLNIELEKEKEKVRDLESKKIYFIKMFGKYFENNLK